MKYSFLQSAMENGNQTFDCMELSDLTVTVPFGNHVPSVLENELNSYIKEKLLKDELLHLPIQIYQDSDKLISISVAKSYIFPILLKTTRKSLGYTDVMMAHKLKFSFLHEYQAFEMEGDPYLSDVLRVIEELPGFPYYLLFD